MFGPDETESNKLADECTRRGKKVWMGEYFPEDADGGNLAPDGRVMEMLSEHTCEGWLEGYVLTGRHGSAQRYESFIHVIDSMVNQARENPSLQVAREVPRGRVAQQGLVAQHPPDRRRLAPRPQRIHPPRPGLPRRRRQQVPRSRPHLPPPRRQLPAVASWTTASSYNYVNVIVADKQNHLQYLDMDAAIAHCTKGIGIWDWASNAEAEPDLVMASCGDVPTHEALAATDCSCEHFPISRSASSTSSTSSSSSRRRPPARPDRREWIALFTDNKPIIFNFHSYPWLVHRLTTSDRGNSNMHVRGYKEKGNIDTPLELAIRNQTDRFSLAIDAIDRVLALATVVRIRERLLDRQIQCRAYAFEHGVDQPEVVQWRWKSPPT